MKIPTLILLLFTACWSHALDHRGRLIFSITIVESDQKVIDKDGNIKPSPQPKIKDGVYFYLEDKNAPTVSGYQYKQGNLHSLASLGSIRTESFLSELDAIGFEAFDFHKLIEEKNYPYSITMGGSKYKLFIDYNEDQFSFTEWNPHGVIETYAEKEGQVKKLKEFVDRFALLYGRRQFGL